jgi:hypothetical protein
MIAPHTAVAIARRETPSMMPENLLWPYDSNRSRMVAVERGPGIANELTRNLREPFKAMMRNQYEDQR